VATITKKVDRAVESGKRYQYWKSNENADDGTSIATGDVFQIETSLGKPAHYVYLETTSGTSLQIRLNSQIVTYPTRDPILNWPYPDKDLENPWVRTDDSMEAVVIGENEVWEFNGVVPVSDIQIVSFDSGSFELFVA